MSAKYENYFAEKKNPKLGWQNHNNLGIKEMTFQDYGSA
jgi:hypothetical protein